MSDWIKCSDRLPEQVKGDYLIVCEGGEIALSEWIEDGGPGGEWGFWYDWDATHWQPLPPRPPNNATLEATMARTYEYWTVKGGEDIAIKLTVAYFSARKGNFSSQAADPDEYFGHCEINWESKDDTSFMTDSEIASMEEWLVNEHSEYLADQDYHD